MLLLLLGTGVLDLIVTPDLASALWQVRIPAVGICLALLLLSYTPGFAGYQHWVVIAFLCTSTYAYLNLSYIDSSPYSFLYSALLGLVPFFLLNMSSSLFKWGVICSTTIVVLSNVVWIAFQSIDMQLLVVYNSFLICSLTMCLFTNYLHEKENRKAYLQLQKERLSRFQRRELEDSSDRFQFLVSLDSVTGIANKSSMNRGYKLEWERSARRKQYLSLLVITVDQFEGYQQCYGMIEADHCLKKVAAELKRFARRPGDIAARYGDNLFYVVLADTGIENAMLVAQNMLDNIRSLEIPNEFSKVEPFVTVSVGAASLIPLPSMFTADLTDKAKRANKVARKQGHDRVVCFSDLV